eukprot:s6663_g6.t1
MALRRSAHEHPLKKTVSGLGGELVACPFRAMMPRLFNPVPGVTFLSGDAVLKAHSLYIIRCIGKEDTEKGVRAFLRRLSFERSSLAARRRRNSISATASTPKGDGQFGLGETEPHGQQESRPLLEEDQEESGLEEDSEEEVKPELEEDDESVAEDSPEPSELKEDDMSELLLMRGLQSGEDHLIPRVFRRYASGNWRGKVQLGLELGGIHLESSSA